MSRSTEKSSFTHYLNSGASNSLNSGASNSPKRQFGDDSEAAALAVLGQYWR